MKKDNYFEFASDEKKNAYLKEIIGYFQDERNEEIGFIAAESVLDFFLETLGKQIYNKALGDAQKLSREKMEELNAEFDFIINK